LQEAQRPRSTSQLITGMFCRAVMGALQFGQAERGVLKVKRSSGAAAGDASPVGRSKSVACERQSRSRIIGSR
jgi:hypothetical protein